MVKDDKVKTAVDKIIESNVKIIRIKLLLNESFLFLLAIMQNNHAPMLTKNP